MIRQAITLEKGFDFGLLAVGFEAGHVTPDLVEDDGEDLPLGEGAGDLAGDDVLLAVIFAPRVGRYTLQYLK